MVIGRVDTEHLGTTFHKEMAATWAAILFGVDRCLTSLSASA
jgi:hypothetical protein